MAKKLWVRALLCLLCITAGMAMGALSKYCDVARSEFLYTVGLLTSGVAVWAILCAWIALISSSPVWAGVHVFLFLAGMLAAYYLVSACYVGYLYPRAIAFWCVMCVVSLGIGWLEWHARNSGRLGSMMRLATVVGIPFLILIEFIAEPLFLPPIVNGVLYGLLLVYLRRRREVELGLCVLCKEIFPARNRDK